ncbi:hypothetical protein D3C87_1939650 [compost metagenome]
MHFVESDEGQLFDLIADPTEIHDLWNHPDCQDTKRRLITEILKWRIRSDLKTQGWTQAVAAGKTSNGH